MHQNPISAGTPPQTTLGELTAPPHSLDEFTSKGRRRKRSGR